MCWLFSQVFILAWSAYSLLAALLFLFSEALIRALRPMVCPIQWVVGAHFLGIEWQVHEAGFAPPFGVKVKDVQALPPLAVCLNAICHDA
jgi:hypothetical protein